MKALKNMDDEEFMEEWTKASETAQAAREKAREFSQEYDRRLTEESAKKRFESMNDSERAALAEVMKAEGIESEETVNENG